MCNLGRREEFPSQGCWNNRATNLTLHIIEAAIKGHTSATIALWLYDW